MAQITLYLDDETRKLVERAAKASGVSQSKWVAQAIRRQAQAHWPQSFLELAGRFQDFPLREDARSLPEDSRRMEW